MNCQNCGKREATVRYTQIINGVKNEIRLCENCAKKLGIESLQFNLPMNFADFLSDFFEDYEAEMLPSFMKENVKCKRCGANYDEFVQTGLLGCPECYETFSEKLEPILKRIQGSMNHVGRGINSKKSKVEKSDEKQNKNQTHEVKKVKDEENNLDEKKQKIKQLNNELKSAIKDERYEDAAKIRDEIKKLQ